MKPTYLVAFAAGVVFAVGLGVSGMTLPAKVSGFLDVTGAWDPSLAFVMAGAIGVHALFARRAKVGTAPRLAPRYELPKARAIDVKLLCGAALFGLGWGISGYCPGPAVVSLVAHAPGTFAFVAAMLGGMLGYALIFERAPAKRPAAAAADGPCMR